MKLFSKRRMPQHGDLIAFKHHNLIRGKDSIWYKGNPYIVWSRVDLHPNTMNVHYYLLNKDLEVMSAAKNFLKTHGKLLARFEDAIG